MPAQANGVMLSKTALHAVHCGMVHPSPERLGQARQAAPSGLWMQKQGPLLLLHDTAKHHAGHTFWQGNISRQSSARDAQARQHINWMDCISYSAYTNIEQLQQRLCTIQCKNNAPIDAKDAVHADKSMQLIVVSSRGNQAVT